MLQGFLCEGKLAELTRALDDAFDDASPLSRAKDASDTLLAFCFEHDDDFSMKAGELLLARITKKSTSLGEQAIRVREILADHYESRGRFKDAIVVLSSIPADASLRSGSALFQLMLSTRIVSLALQADDLALADQQLVKGLVARKSTPDSAENRPHLAEFVMVHAQVYSRKRKYIEAAYLFHEHAMKTRGALPPSTAVGSDSEANSSSSGSASSSAWLESMRRAMVCALLADAGMTRRSNLILMLLNETGSAQLGDLCAILERVHLGRLLRASDEELLETYLEPHQRCVTPTGRTALRNAVVQHNLHSVSRYYDNISFASLSARLNISVQEVEALAGQMIAEGRLSAQLDGVDELVIFVRGSASSLSAPADAFDAHISAVCNTLADLKTEILTQYPALRPAPLQPQTNHVAF